MRKWHKKSNTFYLLYPGLKLSQHNPSCEKQKAIQLLSFNANFQDMRYKQKVVSDMRVFEDFVSEEEDESIMKELDPYMKTRKYEINLWEDTKKLRSQGGILII